MKPPSSRALLEDNYLRAIVDRGIHAFLGNGAGLTLHVMAIDGCRVPFIVSDGKVGKASLFSPRGHYLDYPIHEISRSSAVWTSRRLRTLLYPLAAVLEWGRVDKVVYVNHWLLNGGPMLQLDRERIRTLIATLRSRYPDHALVFSGHVPALAPRLTEDLMALGGRAVQSRIVHVLDPARASRGRTMRRIRHTRKTDAALLKANEFRRVDQPDLLLRHVGQIQHLYSQTYLEKHSGALNPQYRTAFFELLLRSGLFSSVGWLRDDGILEAFNIQHCQDGIMSWSICGHDISAPVSRGLFRLVTAHDLDVATREQRIVNWGGGNGPYKRFRGAEPMFEYDIVFDRHLRADRRLPWLLLQHLRARRNGAPLVPRGPSPES